MTLHTQILIHKPMDYIFVMSEGGVITAYEVLRDGHLSPVDPAVATAQVTVRQEEQLARGPQW